jgi:hypothetical protein
MGPSELLIPRRILTVDSAGRWTAALKTALADFPCELVAWQRTAANDPKSAAQELLSSLQNPSKPCSLVLYHCSLASLDFLELWKEASQISALPTLVALLDCYEPDSVDRLREIGCAQVYAGLHTLKGLVKTVNSIPAPSVILDSQLEEWIAANLPWNS